MVTASRLPERRTNVDYVFDTLHDEILSLKLRPGDRISEAEIAARLGVSRQPVRDAFSRLENLDLVVIRPQRATEIKRFSRLGIRKSRFIRAAIEAEVLRLAAARCDAQGRRTLERSLDEQRAALRAGDYRRFAQLDYTFHQTLCDVAGVPFAYDAIAAEKAKVDRLCVLGLSREDRMPMLLGDHEEIAARVIAGDAEGAVAAGKLHLTRLDDTINAIEKQHPAYFED